MTEQITIPRRHLLASGMIAIGGLAGCLGSDDDEDDREENVEETADNSNTNDETVNAAVSVSDGVATVDSIGDAAGVYCGDADIETVDDIEEGENGATTTGETFPCNSDIYGISESGVTNLITSQ